MQRDTQRYIELLKVAISLYTEDISLGADPSILTSKGNSALEITIVCARISPFPSNNRRRIAEESADLLLQASKQFDVGCNI